MNLYIARNGESLGPYSEAQVREYVKQGVFDKEDLAVPEGREDWKPVSNFLSPVVIKAAASARVPVPDPEPFVATPTAKTGPSLIAIFASEFFGILFAGGVLMGSWYYFLR